MITVVVGDIQEMRNRFADWKEKFARDLHPLVDLIVKSGREIPLGLVWHPGVFRHPREMQDMYDGLRGQEGGTLVLTCHPYFVDCCNVGDVIVYHAGRFAWLVDHPQLDQWQFGLQVGELWMTLGEEWVSELPQEKCA